LWALVTLEMWQRIFLDGEAPAARTPAMDFAAAAS
jgi:hypothetical protein